MRSDGYEQFLHDQTSILRQPTASPRENLIAIIVLLASVSAAIGALAYSRYARAGVVYGGIVLILEGFMSNLCSCGTRGTRGTRLFA